jgi:hypothetical protein
MVSKKSGDISGTVPTRTPRLQRKQRVPPKSHPKEVAIRNFFAPLRTTPMDADAADAKAITGFLRCFKNDFYTSKMEIFFPIQTIVCKELETVKYLHSSYYCSIKCVLTVKKYVVSFASG